MSERNNAFADLGSQFSTKPRTEKKEAPVDRAKLTEIAEENGFESRQPRKRAPAAPEPKKTRRHTTGRNQQLNIKTTKEAVDLFYSLADKHGVPLGKVFEDALDQLKQIGY
jgi:hypothetical protein